MHAVVGWVSADLAYVKSKGVMKMKVKSLLVGTGKPTAFSRE